MKLFFLGVVKFSVEYLKGDLLKLIFITIRNNQASHKTMLSGGAQDKFLYEHRLWVDFITLTYLNVPPLVGMVVLKRTVFLLNFRYHGKFQQPNPRPS